ncbi:E2F-associated phosphoprotein isoform X2 [Chiloscyllium punctatum]|nr:E2F-associated phosphoprotein [Chiloscyllium plagiosum]
MNVQEQDDPYLVEEPSDQEDLSSSSEDELDILLHGTPERKRKLIKEYLTGESESSDDEFEKEMAAELDSTMKIIEKSWELSAEGASSSIGSCCSRAVPGPQYYDEVYFDSDSEAEDDQKECDSKKKHKRRKVLTNDELLYDPDQDDRDQAWVDRQRRGYRGLYNQSNQSKVMPVPTSDAVLNCPSCMTTLCLDCQRHELYKEQYRAMFVMNCIINRGEVLKYKEARNRKRRNKYKKVKGPTAEILPGSPQNSEEEMYHPVRCAECSVEVAVFDKDEVYHFFNVLASHC